NADLIRNGVLAENIRQTFQFTHRLREERSAISLLDKISRLRHGHRHVPVKRHGRARADMNRVFSGSQFKFPQRELPQRLDLEVDFLPSKETDFRRTWPWPLWIFQ